MISLRLICLNLKITVFRILNYIDIDCGPSGDCPKDVEKARQCFRPVFIAGWKRAMKNIESGASKNITNYMNRKCPENLKNQALLTKIPDTFMLEVVG